MLRVLSFSAIAVGLLSLLAGAGQAQAPKYHHLHHALWELRDARVELKEAKHDFGGHREKALRAVDGAIRQLDLCIKFVGGKVPARIDAGVYKKYAKHPHIHHAVVELRAARRQLKEAKHDFGGHREDALRNTRFAIEQLEICSKY